jgi:hypothetical protein
MNVWEAKLGECVLGYVKNSEDTWWVCYPTYLRWDSMKLHPVSSYTQAESFFRHRLPGVVRRELSLELIHRET